MKIRLEGETITSDEFLQLLEEQQEKEEKKEKGKKKAAEQSSEGNFLKPLAKRMLAIHFTPSYKHS